MKVYRHLDGHYRWELRLHPDRHQRHDPRGIGYCEHCVYFEVCWSVERGLWLAGDDEGSDVGAERVAEALTGQLHLPSFVFQMITEEIGERPNFAEFVTFLRTKEGNFTLDQLLQDACLYPDGITKTANQMVIRLAAAIDWEAAMPALAENENCPPDFQWRIVNDPRPPQHALWKLACNDGVTDKVMRKLVEIYASDEHHTSMLAGSRRLPDDLLEQFRHHSSYSIRRQAEQEAEWRKERRERAEWESKQPVEIDVFAIEL